MLAPSNRFANIWRSIVALPVAIKLWLVVLVGTNMASLFFLGQPSAGLVVALVFAGFALTTLIVLVSGGFTRWAGVGHIIAWGPLVALITFARPEGPDEYQFFLTLLLVVITVPLLFDFNDFRLWLAGDRAVLN
ncbi:MULTISPECIES: hypothetical protein [unclassified Marinovum]